MSLFTKFYTNVIMEEDRPSPGWTVELWLLRGSFQRMKMNSVFIHLRSFSNVLEMKSHVGTYFKSLTTIYLSFLGFTSFVNYI